MTPPDWLQPPEPARPPFRPRALAAATDAALAGARPGIRPRRRNSASARAQPVPPSAQRGLAAIALASALLLVSGLLLGTAYLARQAGDPRQGAQGQLASLAWAQDAVGSFAAAHGRLPCPSSARAGFEDCSAGAKGWLPVRSLAAVAGSGPGALHDMHYLVYRGDGSGTPPDPDLAAEPSAPGEAYTPTLANGAPVPGYQPLRSGLDLCAKLRGLLPPAAGSVRWELSDPLTGGPAKATRAHVFGPPGGAVVNIAYGVAVQDAGVTGSASGVNADLSTPALEAPDRPQDAGYSDLVRAVDARALYDGMACGITLASLDTLATAQGWSDDAAGYRQGNIAAGAAVSDILKFFLVADGIGAGMAGVDLINGGVAFATNLTKLTASLVGLPFTLPAVMTYIAGIASAVSGLGLNALDFTAAAAGLTVDSMYTKAYADVARDSLATTVWSGGPALLKDADAQGVGGE